MDIAFSILLGLSNILYFIYEMLMFTGVSILFIQNSDSERYEIFKSVILNSNNYCKDVTVEIGWKCAEIATVTNMFYRKQVIPTIHYLTNDYFRYPILLIKDGEELINIKNIDSHQLDVQEYDLLFYTDYSENDPKKNYTIISETGIKDIKSPIDNKSDINFIIFQLTNRFGAKFDINLKEPKNFLLKNNVLKYSFFKWYMKKVYNRPLSNDYTVNYMSQDMSTVSLKSPFFIKFGEDGVTSFSSKPDPNQIPELSTDENDENDEESEYESEYESYDESEDKSDVVSADESEHNSDIESEDKSDVESGDESDHKSDNESELSTTDEEENDKGPTFCSHECVLRARQNLNNEKNQVKSDKKADENVDEISEQTFDIDFSKNLVTSILKTEQQKQHQE